MGEPDGITQDDVDKAVDYETLGPAYFAARRIAEGVMHASDAESPFKAVATKAADLVRDELYDYIETHLLSDLEVNFQGHLRRLVDDTVQALLVGQEWAIARYALAQNYDGAAVRAAVAQHGGESVLKARIADLEGELARVSDALKWEREYRAGRY